MGELEELLNKLIEKGWKPRGYEGVAFYIENKVINWLGGGKTTFRELVSKESGLWQFVCKNELTTLQIEYNNRIPPERGFRYHWNKHSNVMGEDVKLSKERKRNENYEYRLIESALKDESELEDFLLNNIKIDEKDNM